MTGQAAAVAWYCKKITVGRVPGFGGVGGEVYHTLIAVQYTRTARPRTVTEATRMMDSNERRNAPIKTSTDTQVDGQCSCGQKSALG